MMGKREIAMKLLSALAVGLLFAGPVSAQDWNKGAFAYKAGDYVTAVQEWRSLAEQGDAKSQSALGLMYAKGEGVPQDYAEAVKWYRLAAEQGFVYAQVNLGTAYGNGKGVPQNYAEAVRWHRLAAEQGNVEAQASIGLMIGLGQSVPQDFLTAHMWLNIAAANGMEKMVATRDLVATKITPAQLTEAQRRARVCMESNYQDCGWT